MLIVYSSYNCSSCKKVTEWLTEHGLVYDEFNFFSKGLSEEDVSFLLKYAHNGFEDIISSRSKIYEKYKEELDDMTTPRLINFIIDNPSILKRPLIVDDVTENLIAGYNEITLEELL